MKATYPRLSLDHALLLDDAFEMHALGFSKEEFVNGVKECCRPANADAWEQMLMLTRDFGTRRKAWNYIKREIERARNDR